MAGINGQVFTYRTAANKRIHKYTVMIVSGSTSGQIALYAALPASANAAAVLGVSIEHFLEPNYFVAQGTDPTTVTGSTPTLYDMSKRAIGLQINGEARCILSADGAVTQGDLLVVADAYGRVNNLANLSITTAIVYAVGTAQSSASTTNDVLLVDLQIGQRLAHG